MQIRIKRRSDNGNVEALELVAESPVEARLLGRVCEELWGRNLILESYLPAAKQGEASISLSVRT